MVLALRLVGQIDVAGRGTGARLGEWIDDNFAFAVTLAVLAVVLVGGALGVALRGYSRQRRRNRRLQRTYDGSMQQRIDDLSARVDEMRTELRQYGELNDHLVSQVHLLRDELAPPRTTATRTGDTITLP